MDGIDELERLDAMLQYQLDTAVAPTLYHEAWLSFLPDQAGRALDVGSGSGRDANWLASLGWKVTAVEPMLMCPVETYEDGIELLEDCLPNLLTLFSKPQYDLVLVSNVWPCLSRIEQQQSLIRLYGLIKPDGLLVITWSSSDVSEDTVDEVALQNALVIEGDDFLNPGGRLYTAILSSASLAENNEVSDLAIEK